jgi:hypothetical protein
MTTPTSEGRIVVAVFLVLALGAGTAAMAAEPHRVTRTETWDEHWEHFGERMGEDWGAFGERMGEHWGEFGQRMGEHWGEVGERMGEDWGAFGERMGEHWGEFGQRMGDRWGEYGARTGQRWAHARHVGDRFQDVNDEVPELVELTIESVMDALETLLDSFDHR